MRFERTIYQLVDVIDLIGGGTPKTSVSEYWGGDIPWLSVKDFNDDSRYVYMTEKTITQTGLDNSSTKLLDHDDIIISARGTVGELAMIPFPMAFNQSCYGIRGKKDVIVQPYLYYLLKDSIRFLKRQTHGSVFDTITRDTFAKIEVSLPPIEKQQAIADILCALDDKIALNTKINRNLEQMAQAIFKSWFVDFEPTKPFTEVVQLLGGGTPKTTTTEYWDGSIPFFTPKDAQGLYVLTTEKSLTEAGLKSCNSRLYPANTVFVTARGTVGKLAMTGVPMAMNQSCYALAGNNGYGQYFVYHLALDTVEHLKHKASGAVFDAIVTRDFESEIVAVPPIEAVNSFEDRVKPIYEAILNITNESSHLAILRDTLLPRLMSGELSVADLGNAKDLPKEEKKCLNQTNLH